MENPEEDSICETGGEEYSYLNRLSEFFPELSSVFSELEPKLKKEFNQELERSFEEIKDRESLTKEKQKVLEAILYVLNNFQYWFDHFCIKNIALLKEISIETLLEEKIGNITQDELLSEKFREKTFKKWLEEVQEALDTVGLSEKSAQDLRNGLNNREEKIIISIYQAYVYLRKRGYNVSDLTRGI